MEVTKACGRMEVPEACGMMEVPEACAKVEVPKTGGMIEVLDATAHDSNVDVEVEDVATAHDSNVEVDVESIEPSRVGPNDPSSLTSFKTHIAAAIWNNQEHEPLRCMSKTSTLSEWNWRANSNNGIPVSSAAIALFEDDNDTNFELLVNYIGVTDEEATGQLHQYSDDYVSFSWLRA
ncbi:unnamed protein product [Prunus armeniaca]